MVIFMKRIIAIAIVGGLLLLGARTPKSDAMVRQSEPVKPVANYDTKETAVYTEDGIEADVLFEYTTPDGICTCDRLRSGLSALSARRSGWRALCPR